MKFSINSRPVVLDFQSRQERVRIYGHPKKELKMKCSIIFFMSEDKNFYARIEANTNYDLSDYINQLEEKHVKRIKAKR